jgi:Arc/MetJ family transcription regulator
MSTRLQVVMSKEELAEAHTAAAHHHMTVSAWVRLVLRRDVERAVRGRASAVRERTGGYGEAPAGGPQRVRVEMEVKEELLEAVRDRYHLSSPRAAVEFALRRAAVRPMSKDEALAIEGVGWDGDLGAMRSDDPGATW